jgi:predicted MFS family arabinose efflux permease
MSVPTAPGSGASSPYRWVVLAVGALGAGAFAALRMGLPALSPALRDAYDLTLGQVGLVLSAVAVGVMITLVPWGVLTDRVGERPVLAVGLAGTAAALTGAALATSLTGLLAGLLAAGMLGASATGASGRAVMGWFGRRERGLALGIRQMALPLGGAAASVTLPWAAGLGGVRAALLGLAGLSLTAALAALVWMRDAPPPPLGVPPVTGPAPTRDPRMWRLGAASALLVVGQSALLGFVVLFLHDERGLTAGLAAAALAGLQLGGAVARLAAGRRSDLEGARIPLLRRIAAADAVLLGRHRPVRRRPRGAALSGARRGRGDRDVLERPRLHGGGRDRRTPARWHRRQPPEHDRGGGRGARARRLRCARGGDELDARVRGLRDRSAPRLGRPAPADGRGVGARARARAAPRRRRRGRDGRALSGEPCGPDERPP